MNGLLHADRPAQNVAHLLYAAAGAALVGCILALAGMPALYAVLAIASIIVFAAIATRRPRVVLSAAILLLGLFPFSWGIRMGGVLPKLFGDEVLLIFYIVVLPFLYLARVRVWRPIPRNLVITLGILFCVELLSVGFIHGDLIALRNLIETLLLGPILLIVFFEESSNIGFETLGNAVIWTIMLIAALSLLERVLQRNPILEHVTEITYMSPQLIRLTNGVYRPYVSFFHPSETGTFMVLGTPLVIRKWLREKSVFSAGLLMVLAAALFVNATRGVWVASAAVALLEVPNLMVLLAVLVPAGLGAAAVAYMALRDSPYMQRLTDPTHLYGRFEFWGIAVRGFADHPAFGVGHMQFKNIYLNYARDLNGLARVDLTKVYVADNMYLTQLVEHGAIGLLALLLFFAFAVFSLRQAGKSLSARNCEANATFARAIGLAMIAYAIAGLFADVHLFTKATKLLFILLGLGFASVQLGRESQPESQEEPDRSVLRPV